MERIYFDNKKLPTFYDALMYLKQNNNDILLTNNFEVRSAKNRKLIDFNDTTKYLGCNYESNYTNGILTFYIYGCSEKVNEISKATLTADEKELLSKYRRNKKSLFKPLSKAEKIAKSIDKQKFFFDYVKKNFHYTITDMCNFFGIKDDALFSPSNRFYTFAIPFNSKGKAVGFMENIYDRDKDKKMIQNHYFVRERILVEFRRYDISHIEKFQFAGQDVPNYFQDIIFYCVGNYVIDFLLVRKYNVADDLEGHLRHTDYLSFGDSSETYGWRTYMRNREQLSSSFSTRCNCFIFPLDYSFKEKKDITFDADILGRSIVDYFRHRYEDAVRYMCLDYFNAMNNYKKTKLHFMRAREKFSDFKTFDEYFVEKKGGK